MNEQQDAAQLRPHSTLSTTRVEADWEQRRFNLD